MYQPINLEALIALLIALILELVTFATITCCLRYISIHLTSIYQPINLVALIALLIAFILGLVTFATVTCCLRYLSINLFIYLSIS